ncbi:VWA domain-containing protein [Clostridium sp. YIM B02551]|uniref:VWA domain-containing protein n=1 Tax=Clostridium sp. YIM B02551 TaxID=2910679 RepID=UPI001EEAB04B
MKCGKEMKSNAKFCTNCGEPVGPNETEIVSEYVDKYEENTINAEDLTMSEGQKEEKYYDIDNNDNNDNNDNSDNEINSEDNINEFKNSDELEVTSASQINKNNSMLNKQKKLPKKKLIIAVSAFAIILLGVFIITNIFKNTKSMLNEVETTLASCDEYILDNNKSEYDTLKSRVATEKKEQNNQKIKELLADTKNFITKLEKDNNNIIDNMLKETKAKDTSRAYPDELEKIKGYEDNVTAYKKENKFISAKKVLTDWNNLLITINTNHDNYNVVVNQIDFNSYPKIKVYLSIEDKNTKEVPNNLDPRFFYISEKNADKNEFIKQTIQKVTQLNQQESLNINIVADVSDSMTGAPLQKAQVIMTNFLDQVQFDIKDEVELTAFSNGVRTCASFTDKKELLKNQIANLKTENLTALYDALFAAVNNTAVQNGAKCVVAFTDGQDNFSKVTPDEVIQVAKRYNVPIFIIGIGSGLDTSNLENIAKSTNGLYKQINNISDMSDLYQKIYKQNKEMYLIEYESQEKNNMIDERTLKIDVQTRKEGGGTSYTFTPRMLISTQSDLNNTDEISGLIGNYLRNYIKAINNHDYSYIESYLVPGGGVEKEVKPYIMNDIQEQLLSLEIINKEFKDSDTCIVTTRETYEVQNHDDPLHMRVLEGKYEVKKQSDGKWKILNFADLYKVISKINY